MQDRTEDHAAITALETTYPKWMIWADRFPDGEAVWFAVEWDNAGDVLTAGDPAALGQAIADTIAPSPHLGIVATDPGAWISGPALPSGRTPPNLLTAAVAASIARNPARLHWHGRRWLPAALLRRIGSVLR